MGKEIVREALIFVEEPQERGLAIFSSLGDEPTEAEARRVWDQLEKLQANEPEYIRDIRDISMDHRKGQLAVGLTVYGTQQQLQGRAPAWAREINPDPVMTAWAIEH